MPAYLPPQLVSQMGLGIDYVVRTRGKGKTPYKVIGWDGPVEIVLPGQGPDWMHDAKTLCALIQDSMPPHYKTGGKTREKGSPRHLRTAFSLVHANVKRLPKPRAGFSMRIESPYAAIRNYGGTIPERFAKPGGVMVFQGIAGVRSMGMTAFHGKGKVFTTKAKGFSITGLHFIEKGFERWIKARGHWGVWLTHRMKAVT